MKKCPPCEYNGRNCSDSQFITDCYQAFLHRTPSSQELNSWLGGTWNRPQVISGFANSDEFKNYIKSLFPGYSGLPFRNFSAIMYIGLLDRLAEGEALVYWGNLFDQSADKRETAKYMGRQIVASPEYKGGHTNNEAIVTSPYRGYLGRFPSDGEVSYWAGELSANRQSADSLINLFTASPEFTQILQKYFSL